MTAYSALTDEQRARVAYLFADNHFGTDPRGYEYQVKGGDIRRSPLANENPSTARIKSMRVMAVRDEHLTAAQMDDATNAMESMAYTIAQRIQLEEVTTS